MTAPPKARRARALSEDAETPTEGADGAAPDEASVQGGHLCGWCIVRDCDNHREQTARWRCTCDHARRLPPPAEHYANTRRGSDRDYDLASETDTDTGAEHAPTTEEP